MRNAVYAVSSLDAAQTRSVLQQAAFTGLDRTYKFSGCYSYNGADFPHLKHNFRTPADCSRDCVGFSFFGLNSIGRCFCGSNNPRSSNLREVSTCNYASFGMGGESHFNNIAVYQQLKGLHQRFFFKFYLRDSDFEECHIAC